MPRRLVGGWVSVRPPRRGRQVSRGGPARAWSAARVASFGRSSRSISDSPAGWLGLPRRSQRPWGASWWWWCQQTAARFQSSSGPSQDAGPEVMDLEADALVAAGPAALPVALAHDPLGLLREDRLDPAHDDRFAVVVDEDRFDLGLGAEAFDHRVGQRDPGDGRGSVERDLHDQMRCRCTRGLVTAPRRVGSGTARRARRHRGARGCPRAGLSPGASARSSRS